MIGMKGLRAGIVAVLAVLAAHVAPAHAQLVDTPQNLLKAWAEGYASRGGEPMGKVYAPDAHLWGSQAKEPAIGIANIKAHFDRTGQGVAERSATITKMQMNPRKRVTLVTGTMELKAKLKDGTARNNQARFTMSIVRESRRQWSILSHHVSLMPQ